MGNQDKAKAAEKKKSALKKKSTPLKTQKPTQGKTKGKTQPKKTMSQSKAKTKTPVTKKSNVKKTTKPVVSKKVSVKKAANTKTTPKAKPVKAKVTAQTTSKQVKKVTKMTKESSKPVPKARSESIKQALQLIKEASKTASKRKSIPNKKYVHVVPTIMEKPKTAKPMAVKNKTLVKKPVTTLKNAKASSQKMKVEAKTKVAQTRTAKKVVASKNITKPQNDTKSKQTDKEVSEKSKGKSVKQKDAIVKSGRNKEKTVKKAPDVIQKREIETTSSETKPTSKKRKLESTDQKKDVPAKKSATEIKPKPKATALKIKQTDKETAKLLQRSPRQRKPKIFHDFLVFTDKGAPDKKMMDSEKMTQNEKQKRKAENGPNKNVPLKKVKKSEEQGGDVPKSEKVIKPASDDKENKQIKVRKINRTIHSKDKKIVVSGEREKLTKVKNKENKNIETPKKKEAAKKKTATSRKNGKKNTVDEDEPNDLNMKAILACERKVQWKDDRSPCWITGIAALVTGQTIMADMSNKKIKLLDMDYNVVAGLSLPSCPQAMCANPNEKKSAYFTMPFEKCGIQKVTATKGDCLEITERIPTVGTTRGITCTKEGIITTVESQTGGKNYNEGFRIDIMDFKGKVLKSIQNQDLLKLPLYLAASNSTDIIIANCRKGSPSIVKIDTQGAVNYKYEGESSRKMSIEPRGITMDEEHNVYVSEWRNNHVYILSPTGKLSKILLKGEDIMTVGSFFSRPYQLCYSRFEGKPRKLIVSFESWDRIKIFNLIKIQQT